MSTERRHLLLWISLPLGLFLFASLWFTESLVWHLGIFALTIILAVLRSVSFRLVFQRILPIVLFLLIAQLLLSSYSRSLLFALIDGEFQWDQWKYSLFAVERLALPLIAVISVQKDLADPRNMQALGAFVQPLAILRLPVAKFQLMLGMALKFLPFLQSEWERFHAARNSFRQLQDPGKSTLKQQIRRNLTLLKAMISHIFRKAAQTGDMLALRGAGLRPSPLDMANFMLLSLLWLLVFILFMSMIPEFLAVWSGIGVWYVLMQLSLKSDRTT